MVIKNQKIKTNFEILTSPLWYNHMITDHPLYFPAWKKARILYVKDILNTEGMVMEYDKIQNPFQSHDLN